MPPFSPTEYTGAIEKIMQAWSDDYRRRAMPLIKRVRDLVGQGIDVGLAVNATIIDAKINAALGDAKFFEVNRQTITDAVFQAAAAGYGIAPADIAAPQQAIITSKILTLPWAPDRMNLDTRLHGADQATRAKINQVLREAMTNGTAWVGLARQLYDGYNAGRLTGTADLPDYLKRLEGLARAALAGDARAFVEYGKVLKYVERRTAALAAGGTPTRALQTAYKQLLDATTSGNAKAMDKAVYVAIMEKSRYFAERIARTEIARAWGDGFFADTWGDPDVGAYRWRLSSRHPMADVCDFHAHADLYGLGMGVYPRDRVPRWPAHPHCLCHFEPIYNSELDGLTTHRDDDFLRRSGREYLLDQPSDVLDALLGRQGAEAFRNGADWRDHLRGWEGHTNPDPRLGPRDFGDKPTPPSLPAITPTAPAPQASGRAATIEDEIRQSFTQVLGEKRDWILDDLARVPANMQRLALDNWQKMVYIETNGGSSCRGYTVKVYGGYNRERWLRTFWHEYGHYMGKRAISAKVGKDVQFADIADEVLAAGQPGELWAAMKEDANSFSRRSPKYAAKRQRVVDEVCNRGAKFHDHPAVSDIVCSSTGGDLRGAWGHDPDYYRQRPGTGRGREVFANYWQVYSQNDTEAITWLREVFPATTAEFERTLKLWEGNQWHRY